MIYRHVKRGTLDSETLWALLGVAMAGVMLVVAFGALMIDW